MLQTITTAGGYCYYNHIPLPISSAAADDIGKERKLEDIIKVSPKDEHTSTTCVSNKGEVNTARSLQFKLMLMHHVTLLSKEVL